MASLLRQATAALRLSATRPTPIPFQALGGVSIKALGKKRAVEGQIRCASTRFPADATDATGAEGQGSDGKGGPSTQEPLSAFSMYLSELDKVGTRPAVSAVRNVSVPAFENAFEARPRWGWTTPTDSTTGRSQPVSNGDVTGAYRLMSAVLNRNAIRRELRLGDRYEKPNQMRRRKASERHRRRFADMVRKKVQLVMQMRKRGE